MVASDQESMAMMIKDHNHMIKGKRTKRQKPISHLSLTITTTATTTTSSSSTTTAVLTCGGGFGGSTAEEEGEEEEMAKCLILLAKRQPSGTRLNNVYQCKTCDISFSSFQALGGHRASHMIRPKTTTLKKTQEENIVLRDSDDSCRRSKKIRVHECSMCGAEFSSGQALGGHMRRHRIAVANDDDRVECVKLKPKKSRNDMLMLDLNLPAGPEENDEDDDDLGGYTGFNLLGQKNMFWC